MQAPYETDLDANGNQDCNIPYVFYTTISDAIDLAGESNIIELHSPELLYLFEIYKLINIGGTTNPYVSIE